MGNGRHGIEAIAEWATSLRTDDVPSGVRDLCRTQRRSVLGAVAASAADGAAARLLAAVERWAGDGPVPLIGRARRVDLADAVYAAAAQSVALDYDDYVCFGHTGHSAVLVPILAAAETSGDGADQLLAQVIANEVEARLGGAILLGPMNGQLWAYIHAAGSALAAGRMMGLEAHALAHALAIALSHPVRPTVPGFMAPDSKLLVAAEPAAAGVRAARLAAAGVTGPLDTLDDEHGVLDALAYAPIRGLLDGLGDGWATTTLSVKPYPGCAYIDTTVDALLELQPVEPGDVDEVYVDAGMLTCGMDALSRPYARIDPPTPVTVTFSIPWNVAIVLLAGHLTEEQTNEEWLRAHREELGELVRRVRLRHDASLTSDTARAFAEVLPTRDLVREVGPRHLLSAIRRLRREHPGTRIGLADLPELVKAAREARRAVTRPRTPTDPLSPWWRAEALEGFAMTFPARVTVRMRDGEVRTATASVPRGGAGNEHASPERVSREKLARSGPRMWGASGTAAIDQAIEADDAKLFEFLGAPA